MVGHPQSLVLSPRLDVPQSRDRAVASVAIHDSRNHGYTGCATGLSQADFHRITSRHWCWRFCCPDPSFAERDERGSPNGIDVATKTDRHSPLARGVLRRVGCGAGKRAGSPARTWVDSSRTRCEWRGNIPIPTCNDRPNQHRIGLSTRRSTMRVGHALCWSPLRERFQGALKRPGVAVADWSCWEYRISDHPRRTMDWDRAVRPVRECCGRCGGYGTHAPPLP